MQRGGPAGNAPRPGPAAPSANPDSAAEPLPPAGSGALPPAAAPQALLDRVAALERTVADLTEEVERLSTASSPAAESAPAPAPPPDPVEELRRALSQLPPESEEAGQTAFQLAWKIREAGDLRAATDLMEEISRYRDASEGLRATALVRTAQFAAAAGDEPRALRAAEDALRAMESHESTEWAVREGEKCREVLKTLDR